MATLHDNIDKDRFKQRKRWAHIPKYRKYLEGEHDVTIPEKMRKILEGILENDFCDNVSLQIVTEARDRVVFQGWMASKKENASEKAKKKPRKPFKDTLLEPHVDETVEAQEKPEKPSGTKPNPSEPDPKQEEAPDPQQEAADKTTSWLADLFASERLNDRAGEVHFSTFGDGDHAVLVQFNNDKNRVELIREPWWDGKTGVYVHYDDNDRPKYAVKDWITEDGDLRRNIYWPGEIERWIKKENAGEFERFSLPEDEGQWPVLWKGKDGEDLGIPVLHFANGRMGDKIYGRSELAGGVLGAQDALTGMMYDMAGGSRLTAFQIYTACGVEMDAELEASAGQVWKAEKPEASFGALPPGNMEGVISIYRLRLQRLSQMTQTPYHLISGGEWPSGEALMRAEQPSIGKAKKQIARLHDCWVGVGVMAIKVWNAFGKGEKIEHDLSKVMITAKFADPARPDPLSQAAVVTQVKDIVSEEESLRIMGYPEDRINQIVDEKEQKAEREIERGQIATERGLTFQSQLPPPPGKGPKPSKPAPKKSGA